MTKGAATIFKGKDIVYRLVGIEYIDDEAYDEIQLYIGTNYGLSKILPADKDLEGAIDFSKYNSYRHRTYVDNELMFESVWEYSAQQWESVYDLLDELEAEVEAAKQKLAEATGKLIALGQL